MHKYKVNINNFCPEFKLISVFCENKCYVTCTSKIIEYWWQFILKSLARPQERREYQKEVISKSLIKTGKFLFNKKSKKGDYFDNTSKITLIHFLISVAKHQLFSIISMPGKDVSSCLAIDINISTWMSQKFWDILVMWDTIQQLQMPLLKLWRWWTTLEWETQSSPDTLWVLLIRFLSIVVQSAGAIEYTDCTSVEG